MVSVEGTPSFIPSPSHPCHLCSASSPWPGGAAGPSEPFSTAPGVQATAGEGAGRTRRRK